MRRMRLLEANAGQLLMTAHYTPAILDAGWWVSYAYRDGRKIATCSSRDSAEEAERAAAMWAGVEWEEIGDE